MSKVLHSSVLKELVHLTNPVIPEASSDVYNINLNCKIFYQLNINVQTLRVELKAKGCFDVNLIRVLSDQSTGQDSILCVIGVAAANRDNTGGRLMGSSFLASFSGVFEASKNPNILDDLLSSCVTARSLGRLAGDRLLRKRTVEEQFDSMLDPL